MTAWSWPEFGLAIFSFAVGYGIGAWRRESYHDYGSDGPPPYTINRSGNIRVDVKHKAKRIADLRKRLHQETGK